MSLSRREVLAGAASLGAAHAAAGERYRLGCQTLPYRNFPLARAIEGIRKAGYRYVMPFATHEGKPVYTPALPAAERAELRRRFADAGLTPIMAFAGLSGDIRKPEGMKTFLGEIDLAAEFGIPVVVGAGPWYYTKFPTVPKRGARLEDRVRRVLRRARARREACRDDSGDRDAQAPHRDHGHCRGVSGARPAHRFRSFQDLLGCRKRLVLRGDLPRSRPGGPGALREGGMHKGSQGFTRAGRFPRFPGEGQIDHEAMFRTLFAGGFSGPLTVERVDGKGEPAPPEVLDERVTRAFRFLTPLLERAAGT